MNARVLATPTHAKRMVAALQENLARYEQAFGEIESVNPNNRPNGQQLNE